MTSKNKGRSRETKHLTHSLRQSPSYIVTADVRWAEEEEEKQTFGRGRRCFVISSARLHRFPVQNWTKVYILIWVTLRSLMAYRVCLNERMRTDSLIGKLIDSAVIILCHNFAQPCIAAPLILRILKRLTRAQPSGSRRSCLRINRWYYDIVVESHKNKEILICNNSK